MLIYFHGLELEWVLIYGFILLVFLVLPVLVIIIVSLSVVYKHLKNSKNEIQELNLTENENKTPSNSN